MSPVVVYGRPSLPLGVTVGLGAVLAAVAVLYGWAEGTAAGVAWLWMAGLGAAGTWLCLRQGWDDRFARVMLGVFWVAFVSRLLTCLWFYHLYMTMPFVDAHTYVLFGERAAREWMAQGVASVPGYLTDTGATRSNLGQYLFTTLHFLVDPTPFFTLISYAFLNAVSVVLMMRMALEIFPRWDQRPTLLLGAWMLAVFPLSHYWGAQVLKDTPSAFLTLLFMDQLVAHLRRPAARHVVAMVLVTGLLLYFRLYFLPLLAGTAVVAVLVHPHVRGKGWMVLAMAGLMVVVAVSPVGQRFTHMALREGVLDLVLEMRRSASSQALVSVEEQLSLGTMVRMLPYGFLRQLLSPLPVFTPDLTVNGVVQIACTLVWYALLPFSLYGWVVLLWERRRRGAAVWVFVAVYILFFSLVVVAADPRRNLHMFPFWVFLGALGYRRMGLVHPWPYLVYLMITGITMLSYVNMEDLRATLNPVFTLAVLSGAVVLLRVRPPRREAGVPPMAS